MASLPTAKGFSRNNPPPAETPSSIDYNVVVDERDGYFILSIPPLSIKVVDEDLKKAFNKISECKKEALAELAILEIPAPCPRSVRKTPCLGAATVAGLLSFALVIFFVLQEVVSHSAEKVSWGRESQRLTQILGTLLDYRMRVESQHLVANHWTNLALGKPAQMSSAGPGFRDPQAAVDGKRYHPTTGFSTNLEILSAPWWQVDLVAPGQISEIWIFPATDHPHSAKNVRILLSNDGKAWTLVHTDAVAPVSGGKPHYLRVAFGKPETARFVRVQLKTPGGLVLDQVEVWGQP